MTIAIALVIILGLPIWAIYVQIQENKIGRAKYKTYAEMEAYDEGRRAAEKDRSP